jgi:hypothetical protein
VVLVILAVIWAAVLIPPWLHNRRERTPVQSMASFHRRLATIERTAAVGHTYAEWMDVDPPGLHPGEGAGYDDDEDPLGPAGAPVPRVSLQALRRRRQVFFGLLFAVVVTLAAAVATGDVTAWVGHGVTVLMFGSYIGLLVRHHRRVNEQVAKVRYLSPIRAPRPAVVVLRSGTAR